MWDYEYLYDQNFLIELDQQQNQTQYIRLTVLTMQNAPIGTIEGKTTGGNISINGSSSIRRSGSLSMLADASNYRITELQNIIYMNKKVAIEIGIKNTLNQYQDNDIIWFPQGVFVMSGAKISKNNSGISIEVTLKDQMSLLNGENGGIFETTVTHSPMAVEKTNDFGVIISEEPVQFYHLIYELVTEWGHIPKEYVIIEDVPLTIENIVRWVGNDPVHIEETDNTISLTSPPSAGQTTSNYSRGDSIGYQEVDYVYPTESELVSNAGDSITSVLDKIKSALGNYEYFFDIKGFFHFQKIKDYLTEGVGIQELNEALTLKYNITSNKSVYDFSTAKLVSAYSNAPQWQNIKNDFVVWGKRSENSQAFRYHLIIDKVPETTVASNIILYWYYDAFNVRRYVATEEESLQKKDYAQRYATQYGFTTMPNTSTGQVSISTRCQFTDWRLAAYCKSILDSKKYFYSYELIEEIPKIYDLATLSFSEDKKVSCQFQAGATPNTLSYWIDIVDHISLDKFMVSNIGKRTKSITNDKINCLFDPKFPDIRFIEAGKPNTATLRNKYRILGKPFYQLQSDSYEKLAIGMATNSAYEHLRAQLHTILSFNESVSINIMPIYHLEPNTCIIIRDNDTNIDGDYIIKSFSLPLAAGNQITLQCSKAAQMT